MIYFLVAVSCSVWHGSNPTNSVSIHIYIYIDMCMYVSIRVYVIGYVVHRHICRHVYVFI